MRKLGGRGVIWLCNLDLVEDSRKVWYFARRRWHLPAREAVAQQARGLDDQRTLVFYINVSVLATLTTDHTLRHVRHLPQPTRLISTSPSAHPGRPQINLRQTNHVVSFQLFEKPDRDPTFRTPRPRPESVALGGSISAASSVHAGEREFVILERPLAVLKFCRSRGTEGRWERRMFILHHVSDTRAATLLPVAEAALSLLETCPSGATVGREEHARFWLAWRRLGP